MSAYGEKLDLPISIAPGTSKEAVCSLSGERYLLENNTVKRL